MRNFGFNLLKRMIGDEKILVLDDLFNEEEKRSIELNFFGNGFPWFTDEDEFTVPPSENSDENTFEYTHFCHNFIVDGKIRSDCIRYIEVVVEKIQNYLKCNFQFERVKVNLQTKVETKLLYNTPHTDDLKEHFVLLYYVNNSDGKTYIFKNDKKPFLIEKIIESKAGRVVIFNGKKVHSGSHPSVGKRIVVNFNIVKSRREFLIEDCLKLIESNNDSTSSKIIRDHFKLYE